MTATPREILAACGGVEHPHRCAARRALPLLGEDCPDVADCLRLLLPGQPCALVRFELFSNGRSCLPFASGNFEAVHGISWDEVRHDTDPLFRMVHPEDFDRVMVSMSHSARTRAPWLQEYRVLVPGGGQRRLRSCLVPHLSRAGTVVGFGLIADVTEECRAREELLELCRLGKLGVFRTDGDGRYLEVSREFAQLCGFDTPEELLARYPSMPAQCGEHPEEHAAVKRVLERVGDIQLYALALRAADGSTVWISLNLRALRDREGRVACCEGYCADISAQMRRQLALGRCDELGRARFGEEAMRAGRRSGAERQGGAGFCPVLAHVRRNIAWRLRLPRL